MESYASLCYVRFNFLIAVLVKMQFFWNVIACLWESNYRHFEGSLGLLKGKTAE